MRVGIVGLGLIGGSVAMGLKESGLTTDIFGFDFDVEAGKSMLRRGFLSAFQPEIPIDLDVDAWIIATPPTEILPSIERAAFCGRQDALIMDTCSVKGSILSGISDRIKPRFIGTHPIAGIALKGNAYSTSTMFVDAPWVVCKTPLTQPQYLRTADRLIYALDAQPIEMEAAEHDRHLALYSHLPHILAISLLSMSSSLTMQALGGPSWRDLTRIGASNPEMWRQILTMNQEFVIEHIDDLITQLNRLREKLEHSDREGIEDAFKLANEIKARDA